MPTSVISADKSERLRVRITRVRPQHVDMPLPTHATSGSVGVDLRAAVTIPFLLNSGDRQVLPTGITIQLPPGYEAQVRPRSGLAIDHGIITILGTIDSDYRGEIHVILYNCSDQPFIINPGDRIAQLVIAPVILPEWEEVGFDELEVTSRGAGGLGHTGR